MCIRDSYKAIVGMVNGMLEELKITVPVALHLDHGSYEHCYKCMDAGFSSVMFDGSHYPIEENVAKTKELVNIVKGKPSFEEIYSYLVLFLEPFYKENTKSNSVWDNDKKEWSDDK